MIPLVPVAMFGGLLLFLASKSKGWTSSDTEYSSKDVEALTIWKTVRVGDNEGSARYFKDSFTASLGIQLKFFDLDLASQSGNTLVYALRPNTTGTGTAANAAWLARSSAQLTILPLALALGKMKADRKYYMIVCPKARVLSFPFKNSGYAIHYDISQDGMADYPSLPTGEVKPIGPIGPTGPFIPYKPPTGFPDVSIPATYDPGKVKDYGYVFDDGMSDEERALAAQLLNDDSATPESLELAAKGAEYRGFPKCALLFRTRASVLRERIAKKQPQPVKPPDSWAKPPDSWAKPPAPVPPIPPVSVPPVPDVIPPIPDVIPPIPDVVPPPPAKNDNMPFVIRPTASDPGIAGDLPYNVAKHYTGDGMRWKELPSTNPGMKIVTTQWGLNLSPWKVGQTVMLPASWQPWGKPLPPLAGMPATPPTDKHDDLPEPIKADIPTPPKDGGLFPGIFSAKN